MRPILAFSLLTLAISPIAAAQDWTISGATGPFIFGHFAERTVTIRTENGSTTTRSVLSATTRAGAAADIERGFNRWLGLRLEAAWTRAPLRLKAASGGDGVSIDAASLNVTTLVLPVVLHLNHAAAFRFHVMGGPAYALYDIHRTASTTPLFQGTRGRWGAAAGVGVAWWWNPRIAFEWQASDIVTGSPFHRQEIAASSTGVRIQKPQNGHTTIGIRYRL